MKYSQVIGIISSLLLVASCFLPWSFIASQHLQVTGLNLSVPNFGRPGLLNVILAGLLILFFLIPRIWAKRLNVFLAAFNLAWSIRNYLLVTSCEAGDCPEKKGGIYLLLILSVIIMLMTFLPSLKITEEET
jgi:hypothetical protein